MLAITNEPDSSPWKCGGGNFQLLRGGNKIPFQICMALPPTFAQPPALLLSHRGAVMASCVIDQPSGKTG